MNYAYGVAADSIIVEMDNSLEGIYYGASQMGYECLKHKNFYIQMAQYETQNSFAQHFTHNVESVYRRKLTELGYLTDSDVQRQQIVHYFCVGICTFYIDWIYSGMNESPDYVAATIIKCMPGEIKEAFDSTIT